MIDYVLPRIGGPHAYPVSWIERMRVAIEVLSRLVLRLEPSIAETIFDRALELYKKRSGCRTSVAFRACPEPIETLLGDSTRRASDRPRP